MLQAVLPLCPNKPSVLIKFSGSKLHIKTSGIDPRYDIYYFFDNFFILYLILSPQMITPGLDLSTDARETENCNSVPAGTEFQKLSKIS